jgi:hypothetical protein
VVATGGGQIRTTWTDTMTGLAQIEDQPAGTSSRWVEDVNVGERVLAFVQSSNSELLSAQTAMARSGSDIAAVIFEGFIPGDDSAHAVNFLASVGINAISCRSGEFSEALRRMEQGAATVGTPITAPVPEVVEEEEVAA